MSETKRNGLAELHWAEGLQLRPHHFQTFQRQTQATIHWANQGQPFRWGVKRLEVDKASLENFVVSINECEAVLPDGTIVSPENSTIPDLPFKDSFEPGVDNVLEVWLGVPKWSSGSNIAGSADRDTPRRFRVSPVEVADENTGVNPQTIEVRHLNARLFLGDDESLRRFYSSILLLKVSIAGDDGYLPQQTPYIPPTLDVRSSETLLQCAGDVLKHAQAVAAPLARKIQERKLHFGVEAGGNPEMMMKLHVLNSFIPYYECLLNASCFHPWPIYCELCKLGGQLAIFTKERFPPTFPTYEHDDPLTSFKEVSSLLDNLLHRLYIPRPPHCRFKPWGIYEVAPIKPEWRAPMNRFYIAVDSRLQKQEVEHIMLHQVSLGAKSQIADLATRRVPGLGRAVELRTPPLLPASPQRRYFALDRRSPEDDDPFVGQENLALYNGSDEQSLIFRLYVLTEQEDWDEFELED